MRFVIDKDACVRKASVVKSSGYFRLDKASLDFAMNLKFPPSVVAQMKKLDDDEPTVDFPMVWKLVVQPAQPAYVPGDKCSNSLCVDEAPPPPPQDPRGEPPEPGYQWTPGYYQHYAKTGYQWNPGEWQTARPGYHWSPPHWEPFKSKWLFVPGLWEPDR